MDSIQRHEASPSRSPEFLRENKQKICKQPLKSALNVELLLSCKIKYFFIFNCILKFTYWPVNK